MGLRWILAALLNILKGFDHRPSIQKYGFLLTKYTATQNYQMPFDAQLGISLKPKNMPLRFSLTAQHLFNFDITYDDPNKTTSTNTLGEIANNEISFIGKLSRHIVMGGEFILGKRSMCVWDTISLIELL